MKRFYLTLFIPFLTTVALAEHCPSVTELKSKTLTGWNAYDSDDGKPLSAKQTELFKKAAEEFALAEWTSLDHKSGMIHCYYRDKNGSNLEAYFAKDSFAPQNAKKSWYEVSGAMHCAASMEMCEFKHTQGLQEHQLAKK